jgi:hypothetical protein
MHKQMTRVFVGAVAGLAGAWAMRQVLTFWHTNWGAAARHGAFGLDAEADIRSVEMLAMKLSGKPVSRAEAQRIATALHYMYGVSAGVLYAWLADRWPSLRAGFGTGYGTAIWFLGDEIPIIVAGISDPCEKSAASHVSALAAHLLFGTVVELGSRCGLGLMR